MKDLLLGEGLTLPVDAVTETFALLAVRGAGKSNAARVMAEEMFAAKLPFVAVDPVGSWYGLRGGRAGGAGLPIPIFGGRHGDMPLEKGAGQLIADLVVDQRLSCVLDLSTFDSEGSKKAFLLDFGRRLYQRNEEPLHLFLEEADDYIPQKPMRDEAYLLRAWENIVRRGRARGLGITLITQRSASVNKSVLTQTGTLIAMRTTSPQDRAAIEDWLRYHAQGREILESLPSLEAGEAWVWSPQFLKQTVRVRFRMSRTLDSGATPKGRESKAPATMADVDLGAIQKRMAATIERAKADDPRELRKRIAELEKQLKAKPVPAGPAKVVERAVLKDAQHKALERIVERMHEAVVEARKIGGLAESVVAAANAIHNALGTAGITKFAEGTQALVSGPEAEEHRRASWPTGPARVAVRPRAVGSPSSGDDIGKGQRLVLRAVAQYPAGVTRERLTILTGYKRSSRDTYLQRLRAAGHVELEGMTILATSAGVEALGADFEPLPTGSMLRDYWRARLPEGELKILEVLVAAFPGWVKRHDLDEATGYKRSSRDTYLQRLSARGLVDCRGAVRASVDLFDAHEATA